jgi:Co/Zn/Cd efflux system component
LQIHKVKIKIGFRKERKVHQHNSTLKRTSFSFGLLFIVFTIEVVGIWQSGSLILFAHIFEVFADTLGYGITLLAAAYANYKDKKGRDHTQVHPEENIAALVNLFTMGLGIVFALGRIAESFTTSKTVEGAWALAGPFAATLVYLAIAMVLRNKDQNPAIRSLRGHSLADIVACSVALAVTIVAILLETHWANPVGAIVLVVVLTIILIWQIKEFVKERKLPMQMAAS